MWSIIIALQPLEYVLIAVTFLLFGQYRTMASRGGTNPPKLPNHMAGRVVLASVGLVAFSFVFNLLISSRRYFWSNTIGTTAVLGAYLALVISKQKRVVIVGAGRNGFPDSILTRGSHSWRDKSILSSDSIRELVNTRAKSYMKTRDTSEKAIRRAFGKRVISNDESKRRVGDRAADTRVTMKQPEIDTTLTDSTTRSVAQSVPPSSASTHQPKQQQRADDWLTP